MQYFCAKCKRRHMVEDIAVDMWPICREEIKVNLSRILNPTEDMSDEEAENLSNVADEVLKYISFTYDDTFVQREDIRINADFALSYQNRDQLLNARDQENVTYGTYVVTLDQLLREYEEFAAAKDFAGVLELIREAVTPEMRSQRVYEKNIVLSFFPNHTVDRATDENGVPFPDAEGNLLGFHHICSHCGCSISAASGRAEEIVVALAGSPRAGKTSCMVAMISSLMDGSCPGVQVVPLGNDPRWQELLVEMGRYKKCIKITKTPSTQSQVPAQSLLVQVGGVKPVQRVLTILDMPGEFWQSGNGLTTGFFQQYAGIYENIDCIWFVVSKATICMSNVPEVSQHVKENLTKDTAEDMAVIRSASPMNLMANLQMLKSQLASKNKSMPPAMVIVTKPDYMVSEVDREDAEHFGLFPGENADVTRENAREYGRMLSLEKGRAYVLHQAPVYQHGHQVREFIKSTNEQFLSAIESTCDDRFYVSLSPYGKPACDEGLETGEVPTPYHELMPFIWTMSINGAIRILHSCKWLRKNFLGITVGDETTQEMIPYHHARRGILSGRDKQTLEDRVAIYAAITNNLLMHPERKLDSAGRPVGIEYISQTTIQHGRK